MANDFIKKAAEQPTIPNPDLTEAPREAAPSFDIENPAETQSPSPEVQSSTEHRETPGMDTEEKSGVAEAVEGITKKLKRPKRKQLADIQPIRDELTREVEHIMEEGLKDAFKELTPSEAQAFKIKGEETALEIRSLLKSAHIKVKKIFKLLLEWLKMLPGINSFFLQQEAKIKADKIMAVHRKHVAMRSHINTK